ncbi:MAG: hypothetical protein GWP91_19375 [Rhodobacterales bacterium]|nr:hypothetical protein [Rhodobacterales bacterium]
MAAGIESGMDHIASAARMDTDGVVSLDRLRPWLVCLAESAWQGAGYRRTKNPRIWSLHDLEILTGRQGPSDSFRAAVRDGAALLSPSAGEWQPALALGAPVSEGVLLGTLAQVGGFLPIIAPAGSAGVVLELKPTGPVECSTGLVQMGERGAQLGGGFTVEEAQDEVPEGVVVICADTDGTVYLYPEPGAPAFAAVGAIVAAQSTLALIEVMKTFNPVRSPRVGTLERVLVTDGEGVEAGQALAWIRTSHVG